MKRFFVVFFIVCIGVLVFENVGLASGRMVETNTTYTYEMMVKDLQELDELYWDLITVYEVGETPYGRKLYLVKLGYGDSDIFINGSHHAREWLSTSLTMKMIEEYALGYFGLEHFKGFDVKDILDQATIWFVPMVNPDGVTLQQKGLEAFPKEVHPTLIKMNEGSTNFDRWKANAQGIDLNRQYPGGWEMVWEPSQSRAYANYKGTKPFEAEEAKVMRDLTHIINPQITVAYHSSGRVIYWNFHTEPENVQRDYQLANAFSQITGYSLVEPKENPYGGGYTDWFIEDFDRPGFTPELAEYPGQTNVDPKYFDQAWERNRNVGLYFAQEGRNLWEKEDQRGRRERASSSEQTLTLTKVKGNIPKLFQWKKQQLIYEYVNEKKLAFRLDQDQTIKLYTLAKSCGEDCNLADTKVGDVFESVDMLQQYVRVMGGRRDIIREAYYELSNGRLEFYIPTVKEGVISLTKVNQALVDVVKAKKGESLQY